MDRSWRLHRRTRPARNPTASGTHAAALDLHLELGVGVGFDDVTRVAAKMDARRHHRLVDPELAWTALRLAGHLRPFLDRPTTARCVDHVDGVEIELLSLRRRRHVELARHGGRVDDARGDVLED